MWSKTVVLTSQLKEDNEKTKSKRWAVTHGVRESSYAGICFKAWSEFFDPKNKTYAVTGSINE